MKRCTGDHHLVGCFLSRLILRLRTNHSEGVRGREDSDQAPTFLDVQAGTSEGVAVIPTAFWSVPVHVVDVGRFPPEFCVRGTSSSSVRWSLVTTGPSVTRLPDSSFKLPNRRQRGPLTTVARPEPPSSQTTRKGAVSRSPGQIEIRGRLAGGEGSAVEAAGSGAGGCDSTGRCGRFRTRHLRGDSPRASASSLYNGAIIVGSRPRESVRI